MRTERFRQLKMLWGEPPILITIILISVLLIVFVLFPLFQVFNNCFIVQEDGKSTGTLRYFIELLSKPYNRQPLYNSVILGLCVSVIGTFIGFMFAYAVTRIDAPFKGFFRALATLPMISPPFVIALSAILLFGRNGLITRKVFLDALGIDLYSAGFDIYGLTGLVIVETLAYFPTAFLTLVGVLSSIDPALEDAAHSLGASSGKALRSVTLPLALPGIAGSMLLLFIESMADFGNPLILSGRFNVLSVQAYLQITGNDNLPGGSALAMVLLIPSLAAYFLQNELLEKRFRRKTFVTLTGKGSGGRVRGVEKRIKYPVFAICTLTVALIFLFYGLVLVGSFTKLWGMNYAFTLENYVEAFRLGWDYMQDSLLLATLATPFTGVLGMLIAYLVKRKRFIGSRLMDVTAMLTFAAPGTVVGIGYLLAFNRTPLQGTAAIIILLFIFRNMPVGIRAAAVALEQIDTSLDDASTNLGASSLTTFRRVLLPLITPAFFAGLAYSFVRCMTAISAVIFVVSGKWNLITVAILGFVENSDFSQAAALSIILISFVMVALGITQMILKLFFKQRIEV
ncbi:iron ABC transporter permease [Candidatus Poribacteria bacterium]|nr:iron ABC transporter permease [Candidatus Poribacteria bacterium]